MWPGEYCDGFVPNSKWVEEYRDWDPNLDFCKWEHREAKMVEAAARMLEERMAHYENLKIFNGKAMK